MTDPAVARGIDEGLAWFRTLDPDEQWKIILEVERQSGIFRDADGRMVDADGALIPVGDPADHPAAGSIRATPVTADAA